MQKNNLYLYGEYVSCNTVLPLTTSFATISADIYANLRNKGTPIDDIDILIVGIAIANNLIIVTNNLRDFEKIESLEIQDWSQ
jgi:tRNA(fMet)-specific endonuclease VapC